MFRIKRPSRHSRIGHLLGKATIYIRIFHLFSEMAFDVACKAESNRDRRNIDMDARQQRVEFLRERISGQRQQARATCGLSNVLSLSCSDVKTIPDAKAFAQVPGSILIQRYGSVKRNYEDELVRFMHDAGEESTSSTRRAINGHLPPSRPLRHRLHDHHLQCGRGSNDMNFEPKWSTYRWSALSSRIA